MKSNSFKQIIKDYFTFTRGERSGIFILVLLILLVFILNIFLRNTKSTERRDFSEIKKIISDWEQSGAKKEAEKYELFRFNPNAIDRKALDSLDLPERIKGNIVKYRESGGRFRTIKDLKKIYGMNDSIIGVITPYVFFDNSQEVGLIKSSGVQPEQITLNEQESAKDENTKPAFNTELNKRFVVELNSADSNQLVTVNGIGAILASRIIKYRNLLGGFHSVAQLSEIYGLRPENYQKIAGSLIADSSSIRKIRLNFSEYRELIRHPYLNKNQVILILNYRSKNGPFNSTEDLIRYNLVDSTTYKKVRIYLTAE